MKKLYSKKQTHQYIEIVSENDKPSNAHIFKLYNELLNTFQVNVRSGYYDLIFSRQFYDAVVEPQINGLTWTELCVLSLFYDAHQGESTQNLTAQTIFALYSLQKE